MSVGARIGAAAALLAVVALVASFAAPPVVSAHEGNPDFRSVIDRVSPAADGVTVEVQDYDSHMALVNRGDHEVVVYGYEDEPYARLLPGGTVQVNRRSPATYLNEDRFAAVRVPASADPEAPPRWRTVGDSGTFVWHDHRMHYMAQGVPSQVTDEGRRTKVFDYEIPIAVDGRAGAIEGTLLWVGAADTSKAPFLVAGAAIVVLGLGGVLLARRRRGREIGASSGSQAPKTRTDSDDAEAW
jgi:phage replication-related protein YjqB (UPF0714/DUF867 family)